MNLEENSKLSVAINFQFFFVWNKNWSIDCIASDKSTKRRGPKCRSAQEGRGKGVGTIVGRKDEGAFYLSILRMYTHLQGLFGPDGYVPLYRLWISS